MKQWPIKGVEETVRLPRMGKIHLGYRRQTQNGEIPVKTDYFVGYDYQRLKATRVKS